MGSVSRYSALERFTDEFREKFESAHQDLIGLQITELNSIEVDYHVSGVIVLSDDRCFDIHHRWATEEECSEGEEILEEDDLSFEEYFNQYNKGKTIVKVEFGTDDRDDEAYLLLYVEDEEDSLTYVAVPVGFDPESLELSGGIAEELITEDEFKAFIKKYYK